MRKYLSGFIVGVILSVTLPVLASSMIGQTVDVTYPVVVDNVYLSKEAIAINGTSYLPVRATAETVGYDVQFDEKNKKVILNRKVVPGVQETQQIPMIPVSQKIGVPANESREKIHLGTLSTLIMVGERKYIYRNGEGYLPLAAFSMYYGWVRAEDKYTITMPNGKTLAFIGDKVDNNNVIREPDDYYIKLSAVGLEALFKKNKSNNDVLWIENL